MPVPEGLRGSAHLLALYISIPTLMIGLLLAAIFVLALAVLMMILMPENTEMLMETVLAYLASREF